MALQVPLILALAAPFPPRSPRELALRPARRVLLEAVRDGAFPGCAAAVGSSQGVQWLEAVGRFDYEGGPEVTPRSLYDLASLTKVIGTTSVVMALYRDGKLRLDDPLSRYLPAFAPNGARDGRERVTIEHLLTHSSGLPPWKPLYEEARGYAGVVEKALETSLIHSPGTVESYSDLGFILLGEAAARAGGRRLEDLERELVFDPLGMKDTMRRPPPGEIARCVPTEKRPPPGGGPAVATRGVVHDENAAAGEGLTGHAGLFSTVEDLALLGAELLRAWRGKGQLLSGEVVRLFTTRRGIVADSSRALGWDTPSGVSSSGTLMGPHAFGHTGFTGTSIWFDPDRDIFILLLSNRVHPTRESSQILRVRREFADVVILCLEGRGRWF